MRIYTPSYKPVSDQLWRIVGFNASSGPNLVAQLRKGLPTSVIDEIHVWSGFKKSSILKMAGISTRNVSRRKSGPQILSPDQSERIARLVRVTDAAVALFEGDKDKAVNWMSKPVRGLGGETPESMIDSESGALEVLDLIGRLEHGVFS
ncbi:DUF2384 domain-containing protein [Photorhabdus temperata]|uniref:Uncharacterized protein n=2 Tax=Photorhabdus temperata TaxID=574560 RepID=U7R0U1_PHOTE|nr:antitoxin Xre/MbcA/ParS toxin-binding domain-containing protein [Photorhabdus temperata]ERT13072.1 hypothetical protein O185_10785 [Photorhabdus temperata J3]KER01842.1 putative toxin-antitoxin system antitoxin component, TIGR02293 family [Photorhabdus temperata subsp. temperata Meg1]MCT8346226.1 DUF2384 domain-containing protein [Photorhabdus temperata]